MRFLLVVLAVAALTACSDSSPTNQDLQKLMALNLPEGMEVKSIQQEEGIENENASEKTSVAKYKAIIELTEPHYVVENYIDDVAIVTLRTEQGSLIELTGVATSTKRAGDSAWVADFKNQHVTPKTPPGTAKSLLGEHVIKGSAEEASLQEKQKVKQAALKEAQLKAKEDAKRAAKQKIENETAQLQQLAIKGARLYGVFENAFDKKYESSIAFNKSQKGQVISGRRTVKNEEKCWFDFTGKIERGELIVTETTTIKEWCYPREWTYKLVNGVLEGKGFFGNSPGTAKYELD